MARKLDFARLNASERARSLARPRLQARLDVTQRLRQLKARLVAPTTQANYWRVYDASGHYLGAGKSPAGALRAAEIGCRTQP